jgi:molecular chaperone GrpE
LFVFQFLFITMASRVFSRAGKEASKRVEAMLKLKQCTAAATRPTALVLMSHTRSSSQQVGFMLASARNARFFSDKAATPPPSEAQETAAAEETVEETPAVEIEGPTKEQLEADLKATRDQLLRSLAEQENTRRIAQRDVQAAKNFAVKSFAKSLLEVSDNLSRALQVVPEELRRDTQNNPTLATLYEGIEMTETILVKALESNGLKKFGVEGELFDPNKHEALYHYPDPNKAPGTVGQLIKVGYLLNDRVLRPAEVGVVKKE